MYNKNLKFRKSLFKVQKHNSAYSLKLEIIYRKNIIIFKKDIHNLYF